MSEEEELKAFEEYLKNMSVEDFDRITKEVDKEIFTKEFYEELHNDSENNINYEKVEK